MLVESNTSSTMNNLFQEGFFGKMKEKKADKKAKEDEANRKAAEDHDKTYKTAVRYINSQYNHGMQFLKSDGSPASDGIAPFAIDRNIKEDLNLLNPNGASFNQDMNNRDGLTDKDKTELKRMAKEKYDSLMAAYKKFTQKCGIKQESVDDLVQEGVLGKRNQVQVKQYVDSEKRSNASRDEAVIAGKRVGRDLEALQSWTIKLDKEPNNTNYQALILRYNACVEDIEYINTRKYMDAKTKKSYVQELRKGMAAADSQRKAYEKDHKSDADEQKKINRATRQHYFDFSAKESADDFDDTSKKIDLITAYAYNEYCALVESTNLDHESGKISDEEYTSIMLEAQEEAGKKMQKSVKAAIANTKNYFSKTSSSVDKVVKGDKYQSIITNAKDLCKKNPAVAKLEVEYDDYTEESDAISKAWTKVDKIIARGKAKKNLTEADGDELKSINEDINKLRGRKKPVKKTANLSAAISALEAVVKAIDDNADSQKGPDKAPIAEVAGWDPAAAKRMADAIAMSGRLNKEMSAVNVRTAMSLKSGIKATIKKARHMKVDDDKDTTESVRIFSSFDENEYMEQVVSHFKNNTRDLNKGEEDDNMYTEGINSILKENTDLDAEVDQLIQEACNNAGIDTRSEEEIEVDNLIAEAVREAEGYSETYDDVVTEGLVTGVLGGAAKAVGGAVKGVADTVTNADKDDATEETVDEEEETEESAINVDDIFSQIFMEAKSKKDDEECDDDECSDDECNDDDDKSDKKSKSKKDDDDDKEEDDKDDEDSDDDSDEEEEPDESEEEECVEQTVDELIEEAARAAGIDTDGTDYMLRNFDEIFGL